MATGKTRQSPARSQAQNRWDAWQAKRVCKRWLSWQVRQEGHTVLRVPPDLRLSFLDLAQVFLLYDAIFQKGKRRLSPDLLARFQAWAEATQNLVKALQEVPHD